MSWVSIEGGAVKTTVAILFAVLVLISSLASANESASFVISGSVAGKNGDPVLAYNTDLDQFLVVWANSTDNKARCRVVKTGGNLGGNPVTVSKKTVGEDLAVAYNSKTKEYLVAFGTYTNGDYANTLYIQRVSSQGALRGGAVKVAFESKKLNWRPALVYNPIDNVYLLIWSKEGLYTADGGDYSAATDGIYARFISSSGALQGAESLVQKMAYQTKDGNVWHLGYQRFALGWQTLTSRYGILASHVVSPDKADDPRNQTIDFLSLSDAGALVGSSRKVSAVGVGDRSSYVSMTQDITTGKWLAAWENKWKEGSSNEGRIYSRLLTSTGSPSGGERKTFENFEDCGRPSVVFNPDEGNSLVVFATDSDFAGPEAWDIYGQFMAANGSPTGDEFSIAANTTTEAEPAVGYNTEIKKFLVVYTEVYGSGDFRIVGNFVAPK